MSKVSDVLDEQLNTIKNINDYAIEIGVISGKTKEKVRVGITNAELMYIHENGSPLKHLPARPVLDMTIKYTQSTLLGSTLDTCLDGVINKDWTENDVEKELSRMCIKMENYARDIIYLNDGRLAANAPSTQAAKGKRSKDKKPYNHPLFDTSQLARSITCRLVRL